MTGRGLRSRVSGVQTLRLHHLRGPRAGESDELCLSRGATALLGRAPDADIVFPDPDGRAVSRRHALLWLASDDPHGWHVVDLGSTAGTHVNGARVQAERLAHGDTLSLGVRGPAMRVELPLERVVPAVVVPADVTDRVAGRRRGDEESRAGG